MAIATRIDQKASFAVLGKEEHDGRKYGTLCGIGYAHVAMEKVPHIFSVLDDHGLIKAQVFSDCFDGLGVC